MKIYIRNQQRRIKVNTQKTARLLRKTLDLLQLPRAEISLLFVNDRRMRLLNLQYRGVDRTTDVLSFPQMGAEELKSRSAEVFSRLRKPLMPGMKPSDVQSSAFSLLLGDIVINLHKAKQQALENRLAFDEELKRLLIHGLLHLLGYDHEQGKHTAGKMQRKSRELFEKLR
jgi:probable rRNA maturation factor